ncbi:RecB family nuclease, putative, TM0106 family [Mycolicibacterium chubuense NBB4]|uniref:RecB family nuclease, putative, TM0106 family n=1 Tax=Mycolicibacterium chubuense (strain NBB4) TaxID=710421 RepID=I4BMU2_MYCCN|nr:TM0106 family RecB-like putative nuclease [Mycolicibacterium chubuense]AFM18599.1 RecB family nuclease, putative, TM0106 family [Mycolicibacterium chubuense NBB4]
MFVADDRVVYSASDLAAAARCEYALLRSFDAKLGWGPAVSGDDELLARTADLGDAHEARHLDELRRGADVAIIGRPDYTVAGLTAAADQTLRAIERRAPVVYQAAMFDGRFAGFADFLILEDGPDGPRYRLRDTKLARSVKVEALLQMAAYAETLAAAGVPIAPEVDLVLGDGASVSYPVDELTPVYRPRRDALQRLLDGHVAGGRPVAWKDEHVRACFRCTECEAQVRASDDLLLVAGMRVSQRARLIDAGITTVHALAGHRGPVPELPVRTVAALTEQARLQISDRVDGKPPYQVVDAQPLMVLPDADRGDLFFDFEGDPLWTADGHEWGLEYLWGVLTVGDDFTPLWAHDRASERRALVEFLTMVRKRRKRYPNMHVYHYAAYEKSTLLRLAGRYGEGEREVDELLRDGVLVDLYPLVRKSIRVGTENYSIKSLEPLYMGNELREGEVTTATASITEYARYCELRHGGHIDDAATVLKEIEEYNRYDCRSTRRLRDWLTARAIESAVPPRGPQPVTGGTQEPAQDPADAVERRLMKFAGDGVEPRSAQQTAVAMYAAAKGFHKREDKPFWWGHFDRVNNPVDEWADSSGVFIAHDHEIVEDWHQPPRARKPQRHVRLFGEIATGELSENMYALYDPPSPRGLSDDPDRRGFARVTVLGCDNPEAPTEVVVCERQPKGGDVYSQVPFALTPDAPISTKPLQDSIAATAAAIADALPRLRAGAMTDLLLRRPPRTRSGAPLPRSGAVESISGDITAALLDLDSSYLAVHGPPGTGKTSTSAVVIAALVDTHGWRVGVVAQSHAVVENLFAEILRAGVDGARVGKKVNSVAEGWTALTNPEFADFVARHDGCVVGGTAWDFANDTKIPAESLDLLVVEEAGQFSLANTIAVSRAARNLLLLGDPQQLPQVSQGTHPEPVDGSALGWLVDGHHTLPPERGYFLDRSHRMHPDVCRAVSRLSYDGRLHSNDAVTATRRLDGVVPGVRTLAIDHDGNATESPEEAAAIVGEIRRLLGTPWTDEKGTRPLAERDVLVVTPYNAQVVLVRRHLDTAGLTKVRAGTVDKFQGQQAPVVFVSMTASSIDDVPRGIAFLLNRNRLNVAVSRAKYLAVIVRSAQLTEYLPGTPDRLVELGAFLSLSACDTPAR